MSGNVSEGSNDKKIIKRIMIIMTIIITKNDNNNENNNNNNNDDKYKQGKRSRRSRLHNAIQYDKPELQ